MTKTTSLFARTLVAAAFTMMAASAAHAAPTTYEIDKVHSSILFKIRHMLSKTAGQFQQFSGTVTVDPDKRDSVEVSAAIVAGSIDTDDAKRDQHLRGADFFDVEKFPQITFTGGNLSGVNADRTKGKVEGMLTLHGVTKPVVLDVEWLGVATDPWGNTKAAFSATTKINRKDFGMVWNKTLDAGGYLIGEEVEIELNIEAAIPKPK